MTRYLARCLRMGAARQALMVWLEVDVRPPLRLSEDSGLALVPERRPQARRSPVREKALGPDLIV